MNSISIGFLWRRRLSYTKISVTEWITSPGFSLKTKITYQSLLAGVCSVCCELFAIASRTAGQCVITLGLLPPLYKLIDIDLWMFDNEIIIQREHSNLPVFCFICLFVEFMLWNAPIDK